jgi:TetR/AcrR family transcriptional repressor of nem operon
MRVTKAQAQANRAHVVETASQLFRERGYDGVGVADLMAAAGFTHGGFYKQFGSKTDLIAESAACGIAQTLALTGGVETAEFIRQYLSREHRDSRGTGCTMAALGGDAARQPDSVRSAFATGIESLVAVLSQSDGNSLVATQVVEAPAT